MKTNDYHRALRYARSQKLFGLFARLTLFFPKIVRHLIKKGRDPGLPKSFLVMPAFQIEPPAYNIRFLGDLRIYKGEKPIRKSKLIPKDAAFLISMSQVKNNRMPLSDIYRNFLPRSKKPSQNLFHLLVRIKKALMLPSHLLKARGDFLIWDFYLSTDYIYFEEIITQAKALARSEEWGFAKREYLRAFKLFRGEPFRKMYDQWSEDMRHRILTQLETETIGFAKSCLEHNNKREARKVLAKVLRIIPYSKEIGNLLKEL